MNSKKIRKGKYVANGGFKMKVVLLSKENMKKKPKSEQKIHFLFTIIAAKTVKTHKKIEKHT